MWNDVPGHVEEWHIPFLLYSCKAAFWIQETSPRLSDVERSVVLQSVFVIGSIATRLLFFQECATHIACDSVLPGLPHISTASDRCWGEKAWVRGYYVTTYLLLLLLLVSSGCYTVFASHPGLKPVHPSFIQYWTWGAQPCGWGPYSMLLPCYI